MTIRKSRTSNSKEAKKFSFQLGLSGLLSLGVLIVVGMAWSFILGVIVGRGYQPEKIALDAAQQILPDDFPLLTEKNEAVLKSEELEFFDKLKQGPSAVTTVVVAAQNAPKQPAQAPAKPQNATVAKVEPKAEVKAEVKTQPKAEPKPKAEIKPEAKPVMPGVADSSAPKDEVFVFNYQVAALASMDQAQTFLKQIEPGGFKTSVVTATHEGKTWYRIYVHHQGTVDSAMALKEKLKASGINNALLRSRTPL